jgi:hypothetical protein
MNTTLQLIEELCLDDWRQIIRESVIKYDLLREDNIYSTVVHTCLSISSNCLDGDASFDDFREVVSKLNATTQEAIDQIVFFQVGERSAAVEKADSEDYMGKGTHAAYQTLKKSSDAVMRHVSDLVEDLADLVRDDPTEDLDDITITLLQEHRQMFEWIWQQCCVANETAIA